jgi:hypothetical protein
VASPRVGGPRPRTAVAGASTPASNFVAGGRFAMSPRLRRYLGFLPSRPPIRARSNPSPESARAAGAVTPLTGRHLQRCCSDTAMVSSHGSSPARRCTAPAATLAPPLLWPLARSLGIAYLHDHDCEDQNCAADWSLFNHVDIPKVSSQSPSLPVPSNQIAAEWFLYTNSYFTHSSQNTFGGSERICGWERQIGLQA